MSRVLRFVRAARALLWAQVAAGTIATALGVWAVVAVRDLASERDRLLAQVSELERNRPVAGPTATPNGVAPSPLDTETRLPAIMPVFVPIVTGPEIPAVPPVEEPPRPEPETPDPNTPQPQDCTGANATQPRCRPGRWNRRDVPVVTRPPTVREEPQRPQPELK